MAAINIANFGPFVLSHLELDLHRKLTVSRVVCLTEMEPVEIFVTDPTGKLPFRPAGDRPVDRQNLQYLNLLFQCQIGKTAVQSTNCIILINIYVYRPANYRISMK